MNEYIKKFAEQAAGKTNKESPSKQKTPMTNGIPNSVLNDVFAGKRRATDKMMGHKQNLAPSIAAKMSQAFGMDLTGMQLYQTDAMAGTGMNGISQGNKVVLSSEVDLNSSAGQAVLGHELSHIHAQSQGVGMGHSGLYNNAALEAKADREGMMAARGQPIYGDSTFENPGMSYGLGMRGVEGLTPLSGGLSATAGAPMQASKTSIYESTQKKIHARVADQLAAFGIRVNEPEQPAPYNPYLNQRSSDAGPVGGGQTPFGFPTSPIVSDPGHSLLPSRQSVEGGGLPMTPTFGDIDDLPSEQEVMTAELKNTDTGAGRSSAADASASMSEARGSSARADKLKSRFRAFKPKGPADLYFGSPDERLKNTTAAAPGDSAKKKKEVVDINRNVPPKKVVDINRNEPLKKIVDINQNLPRQSPLVNDPTDVDDDDFSLFGKEMASVTGNAPIKQESPSFLPEIGDDDDFSLFRDEKKPPVDINHVELPKKVADINRVVSPQKVVDINRVVPIEKKKKKPGIIDINKL